MMNRRSFLLLSAALGIAAPRLAAAAPIKELRIGYQKTAILLVVKARKQLEQRFESQGVSVRWVEFPFGPPLLEALNAGAIDYGYTGDAPPIFAQAAKAAIRYVGVIPARGYGQAIIVPQDSPLRTLADLTGQEGRGRQRFERAQPADRRAGERRSRVERRLAGLSRARRRRERLRARRRRRLVDLGPLLRHRGIEAERAHAADRPQGDDPKQLLSRQSRFPRRATQMSSARSTRRSRPRPIWAGDIATRPRGCSPRRAASTSPPRSVRSIAPSSPSDRSPTKSSPNSKPWRTAFTAWA